MTVLASNTNTGRGYNLGMGGGPSNPYIQQQAQSIADMSNQNLSQQVMPGIRSGALAAGQYGGSRQGIAEGVAAGNAQTGIAAAQAGLYGNAYAQDQQNETARMTAKMQADAQAASAAAAANASLQNGQLNFYSTQRSQDMQQWGLGASLFGQGVQGQAGMGSGMYGTGQTYYQAPQTALQNYGNTLNQFSGLGGSQVTTGGGNPNYAGNALGGALAGSQLAINLGMGSSPVMQNTSAFQGYGGDYNSLGYRP